MAEAAAGGPQARPVGDGRLQLPPYARARLRPPHGRRGQARAAAACAGELSPGLAGRPGVPADLAAAQGGGGLGRARRPGRAHHRPRPAPGGRAAGRGLRADGDVRDGASAARRAAGCRTAALGRPVTVDDAAMFTGRLASGALASFEVSRVAAGRKNALRLELNGTRGSLAFDLERLNELHFHDHTEPAPESGFRRILVTEADHPYLEAWWPPGHGLGYEHTFVHQARDLRPRHRRPAPTRGPPSPTDSRCSGCWRRSRRAREEQRLHRRRRLRRGRGDQRVSPGDQEPASCHDSSRSSPASGPTCRWRRSAALARDFGYDGLELACWGDHFEVDKALERARLRRRAPRACWRSTASSAGRSPTISSARPSATAPSTNGTRASCPPASGATGSPRAYGSGPPPR